MTQVTKPYSGILPLGKLTVATVGTVVSLTTNVGNQTQSSLATQGVKPAKVYRNLQLQAPNTNTGTIFLLPYGNTAAANPGNIIAIVSPGQTVPIPLNRVSVSLDSFVLDTDTNGSVCYGIASEG